MITEVGQRHGTGVIEHHIQLAALFNGQCHQSLYILVLADVSNLVIGFSAFGFYLLCHFFEIFLTTSTHHRNAAHCSDPLSY